MYIIQLRSYALGRETLSYVFPCGAWERESPRCLVLKLLAHYKNERGRYQAGYLIFLKKSLLYTYQPTQ